jgi:tRNA (pseudouridine54-N1)-methyltransferase
MMIQPGVSFAKTDVAGIIKRILYKYKEGKKTEVSPGYFVEKKSLLKLVEELQEQGRSVYVLDKGGEDIREVEIVKDPIFLLGDHHGLPRKELKRLKKMTTPVSIGQRMYFASHTMAVVQNELDRRGL